MHQLSLSKFNIRIFAAAIFSVILYFATLNAASASEELVKNTKT